MRTFTFLRKSDERITDILIYIKKKITNLLKLTFLCESVQICRRCYWYLYFHAKENKYDVNNDRILYKIVKLAKNIENIYIFM